MEFSVDLPMMLPCARVPRVGDMPRPDESDLLFEACFRREEWRLAGNTEDYPAPYPDHYFNRSRDRDTINPEFLDYLQILVTDSLPRERSHRAAEEKYQNTLTAKERRRRYDLSDMERKREDKERIRVAEIRRGIADLDELGSLLNGSKLDSLGQYRVLLGARWLATEFPRAEYDEATIQSLKALRSRPKTVKGRTKAENDRIRRTRQHIVKLRETLGLPKLPGKPDPPVFLDLANPTEEEEREALEYVKDPWFAGSDECLPESMCAWPLSLRRAIWHILAIPACDLDEMHQSVARTRTFDRLERSGITPVHSQRRNPALGTFITAMDRCIPSRHPHGTKFVADMLDLVCAKPDGTKWSRNTIRGYVQRSR